MSRIVRSSRVAQPRDHVEQLVADPRVEPDGRLVEEQHLGLRASARGRSRAGGARRRCSSRPAGRSARTGRARPTARRSGARACAAGTPQSRVWSSRFARPLRPRSTTASWKTTLDTLRASSGYRATSWPRPGPCPRSGRSSSSASPPSSTCRRRWGRAGRTPRPRRPRSRSP